MAITTHSAMCKQQQVRKYSLKLSTLGVLAVCYSASVWAEFDVQAGVGTDVIYQQVKPVNADQRSLTTITFEPTINAAYQSRTVRGSWTGNVTYLERDREDVSQEDTFAEYNYSVQWAPLDRLLVLQASGAINYQNTNVGNFLVSDFVSNSQNLAKARSNQYSATLQLDQGNYIRATGTLGYSDVQSERIALGNGNRLSNDTYQASGQLRNGESARRLFWNLDGSYQKTEGENLRTGNGNFITRRGNANIDLMVIGHWGVRATATHEANQIANRNDTQSLVRQFDSYGAGFIYRQSENRYIALTANRSDSDVAGQEGEEFIGGQLRWALSTRSDIAATYGRRFYGESASASFNYNTSSLRASFEYSEDITNTSRLLSNPENLGVFVCPVNSSAFSDCFQPASLSYQPGIDEQLVELTVPNLEFDDNIILRKSGNAQIGYAFTRITIGASLRYSENEGLDIERLTQTYSAGMTMSYALGSYTNLNARVDYAEVEQRSANFENGTSENWNSSVSLSRQIGRYLRAELSISYLDKDGDLTVGSQFGPQYTDRRISLGISYQYN